jgi:hypothetical protein
VPPTRECQTLAAITSSPTAEASGSLSRTAINVRPIGDRTSRAMAATVSARKNSARYARAALESNRIGPMAPGPGMPMTPTCPCVSDSHFWMTRSMTMPRRGEDQVCRGCGRIDPMP